MIAAVVPAAGRSARLAKPKLLLRIQGEPLISRVVTALRNGGADRVIVVAPPEDCDPGQAVAAAARSARAEVIVPVARPLEMRDSIELGLEALARGKPPESVVLTPGDTPGITSELVARVLDCALRQPHRVIIPTWDGRRGHPVVLPWSLAVFVPVLPPGVGVNALIAAHPDRLTELPVACPKMTADIDTADDLERWNARWPEDSLLEANSQATDETPSAAAIEPRIKVRVRFFALARERAGCSEIDLELRSGGTVAGLRAELCRRLPSLAPLLPSVLIAVNEEYAGDDCVVPHGARIAIIPPVSGGGHPAESRLEVAPTDPRNPPRR